MVLRTAALCDAALCSRMPLDICLTGGMGGDWHSRLTSSGGMRILAEPKHASGGNWIVTEPTEALLDGDWILAEPKHASGGNWIDAEHTEALPEGD